MKMSIPSRGLIEQVTSLEDRFFHLRVLKPFYRACTELLIGSLAHPTIIKNVFLFIRRRYCTSSYSSLDGWRRAYLSPYRENAKRRSPHNISPHVDQESESKVGQFFRYGNRLEWRRCNHRSLTRAGPTTVRPDRSSLFPHTRARDHRSTFGVPRSSSASDKAFFPTPFPFPLLVT
jgi:hypothetical protein